MRHAEAEGLAARTLKREAFACLVFFPCFLVALPPRAQRRAPLTHVLGIELVAEETSARRQEVNSWLARRAEQDVPRVSAQKAKIERGRAQRERSRGERSGADVSHCLGEKNSPFRKQAGCIFSFPSPRPLSGNKSCTIMGGRRGGGLLSRPVWCGRHFVRIQQLGIHGLASEEHIKNCFRKVFRAVLFKFKCVIQAI